MSTNTSRRAFLQRASALSLAGAATPWALNLAAMGEAAAATATDYKALVCVFLYGGNDYGNTLIPVDALELQRLCRHATDARLQRFVAGADNPESVGCSAGRTAICACSRAVAAVAALFDRAHGSDA